MLRLAITIPRSVVPSCYAFALRLHAFILVVGARNHVNLSISNVKVRLPQIAYHIYMFRCSEEPSYRATMLGKPFCQACSIIESAAHTNRLLYL